MNFSKTRQYGILCKNRKIAAARKRASHKQNNHTCANWQWHFSTTDQWTHDLGWPATLDLLHRQPRYTRSWRYCFDLLAGRHGRALHWTSGNFSPSGLWGLGRLLVFTATHSNKTINPSSNGGTTTLTRWIVNHILTDVHTGLPFCKRYRFQGLMHSHPIYGLYYVKQTVGFLHCSSTSVRRSTSSWKPCFSSTTYVARNPSWTDSMSAHFSRRTYPRVCWLVKRQHKMDRCTACVNTLVNSCTVWGENGHQYGLSVARSLVCIERSGEYWEQMHECCLRDGVLAVCLTSSMFV